MGWLSMSKQEVRRVEVLTEVLAGSRTMESAAGLLGVSLRQAQRLVGRYRGGGGGALIHKSRARPASNKLGLGVRELVLELVRQNYYDFGPTLAAEVLLERHGIEVHARPCVSGWSKPACGCPASSAGASISRGYDGSLRVSWCRSTAVNIVGSRTGASPVPCWCSSTMPRAA